MNLRRTCVAAAAVLAGAAVGTPARAANPWMDANLLVVVADQNLQSFAFGALGIPVSYVDRLGPRPIFLLKPQGDPAAALGALNFWRQRLGLRAAGRNRVFASPEQYGANFGAIKNSVNAIGTAQAATSRLPAYWTEPWLAASTLTPISTGAGVRVAVLDTGVDLKHPKLQGHLLPGYDFVAPDGTPAEALPARAPNAYGHGTHVTGVIARVAPGARLMPIRVLDANGSGTLWTVSKGVAYAIDPDGIPSTLDGARVLNLSFGAPSLSTDEHTVLRTVMQFATCHPDLTARLGVFAHAGFNADRSRCRAPQARQTVVVAGQGNNAASPPLSPARYVLPSLIGVTATTPRGELAEWASRGASGQIAAPGQWISSTYPSSSLGDWAIMSGTSMAAPWVSATAALLLATTPPAGGWTGPAVLARLRATGTTVCNPVGPANPPREVAPHRALVNDVSPATACR